MSTSPGAEERATTTILLLDDDPGSLNVLNWVLERHYRILKTGNGEEAVRLCKDTDGQISLVVADIVLQKNRCHQKGPTEIT